MKTTHSKSIVLFTTGSMWSHQRTIQLSRHHGSGLWQMGILFTLFASIYVPIFRWVHDDTCRYLNGWRTMSPLDASVFGTLMRMTDMYLDTDAYSSIQWKSKSYRFNSYIHCDGQRHICNKMKRASHIHEHDNGTKQVVRNVRRAAPREHL